MDHGAEHSEAPLSSGPLDAVGRPSSSTDTAWSITLHLDAHLQPLAWGATHWSPLGERDSMWAAPAAPFDTAAEAVDAVIDQLSQHAGVQLPLF